MSRTEELEKRERERRWAQSGKLQYWEAELRALAKQFWDEDLKNGWAVRYGYVIPGSDPQMTILLNECLFISVTIMLHVIIRWRPGAWKELLQGLLDFRIRTQCLTAARRR